MQTGTDSRQLQTSKWVILIISATGACTLSFYLFQLCSIFQTEEWSKAPAEVTESRVIIDSYMSEGRYGNTLHRRPVLVFQFKYSVSGQQFVSSAFYRCGQPAVYDANTEYPIGQNFEAFYNPQDPSEAVVKPGYANTFYLVFSLILLPVAAVGYRQYVSMKAELVTLPLGNEG